MMRTTYDNVGTYPTRRPEEPMELRIRKVMPPHPGASMTVEQAKAAFKAVEEEQRQERLRRNAVRRMKYHESKRAKAREP